MRARAVGDVMRRVWPLAWPVSVRTATLEGMHGLHRIVYRMVTGPRGGRRLRPTHLVLLDRVKATGETVVHEWAHAADAERRPDHPCLDLDPKSLEYELAAHDDVYWKSYGEIYRALARDDYAAADRGRSL